MRDHVKSTYWRFKSWLHLALSWVGQPVSELRDTSLAIFLSAHFLPFAYTIYTHWRAGDCEPTIYYTNLLDFLYSIPSLISIPWEELNQHIQHNKWMLSVFQSIQRSIGSLPNLGGATDFCCRIQKSWEESTWCSLLVAET